MATASAELTPDSFMQSQGTQSKDLTPDDFMQQQAKPAPEVTSAIDAAIKTVPQPKPPQMQSVPLLDRPQGTSYQAMAPKADARYQQQEAQKFTEEIGAAVPDAAAKPLAAVTHKAIEPFNKYVSDVGTGVGSTLEHAALGVPEAVPNMPADERAYREQQMGGKGLETPQQAETEMASARKQHPVVAGVTRAAGELLGQTAADPRQWPLLFTGSAELKPLFAKLMSGGFAVQMGTDAAENSNDLINNWDKYTPDQRVEKIASTGLTSLFAAMATAHAASPHGAPGHEASKEPPVQEQARQLAPPATVEAVAQPSGAVEKPVQASENLNPDTFMQEEANAVRPSNAQVQARPTSVVERGEGPRPQAGSSNLPQREASSGAGEQGVPTGAEAQRAVPKVDDDKTGFKAAFASAKGAVTDTFVDSAWSRLQSGKKLLFSDRKGTVENRVQLAFDAGSVKSRDDVARVVKAEAVRRREPKDTSGPEAPKKTRLQTAKDIDRVGSGKVAATELTEGYEPKVEKGSKPRYQIARLEDGRRVAYNPAKTNEQTVKEHAAKNELYKLTGDNPPQEKRDEAKADVASANAPNVSTADDGTAGNGSGERASSDVILARHGETALDQKGAKDTVAGWTAEPLDERGKKSAAAMAEELKPEPVSHIVTSDLERAKQTANIVGDKLGVPVTEDSRLRPQHTPETEGKQMGEAKPIHDYYVEHPDERPNGGETYNETLARQRAAISDAKAGSENGEKPVVLTHSRNIEAELGTTPEPGGVVIGDRTAKPRTPGEPLEHGFDFRPAEDRGQQARDAVQKTQGALPRGERRKIERTPDEQATQKYFAQARKELGEEATSDQVMARVGELKTDAKHGPLVIKTIRGTTETFKARTPDEFMQSVDAGSTIKADEPRASGRAEDVSGVPPLAGESRGARTAVPSGGSPKTEGAGETRSGDRPADGRVLERAGGSEGGGREPGGSRGAGAADHPAAEGVRRSGRDVGADGRRVEHPTPESPEAATHTTEELRNARNFKLTPEYRESMSKGGEITKIKGNLDALETLKRIQGEGRESPTEEERAKLAKYVDFGGLASMLQNNWKPEYREHYRRLTGMLSSDELQEIRETMINTHYTSLPVVDRMWKIMERLGFKGGRVLEPGMGIGNFLGAMPEKISGRSQIFGVEKNPLTGAMAKMLYPDANIQVKDFQKWQVPNNSLDAVIGNVPFSEVKVTNDPLYKDPKLSLHNYFIVKSLDKLKPGGVAALITTHYTLDGKSVSAIRAREEMAKRADLVAAIRLPDTAFKGNAGTEVVADLLIFQKRGEHATEMPSWTGTEQMKVGSGEFPVNRYFKEHPEMVLGEHSDQGSMYGSRQYTVKGPKDIQEAFDAAIEKLPEKIFGKKGESAAADLPPSTMDAGELAPDHVKPGAFYKDDKGNVRIKQAGAGVELPADLKSPAKVAHIKAAIDLRDKLNEVMQAQLSAASNDADIKASQKELSKLYDAYTRKYGDLHGPALAKVFRDDPEYPKLLALENLDPDTKKVSKAKIFSERVLAPYEPLRDLPENPKAAMLKVMAHSGYLDLDKMAELLKKPKAEVVASLEKEGLIFRDPVEGHHVSADEYLSGDVRDKLKQAEAAAHTDEAFARNVEELKKVQPAPLTIHEVLPSLGQTWIPTDIYKSFLRHLAGRSYGDVDIRRDQAGKWSVKPERSFNRFDADKKWGTSDVPAHKLVEYALNQQTPTVWDKHSDGSRSVNQEATLAAREKLQMIKEEFRVVLRKAPEATVKQLEDIYNDNFNGHRLREFSGEHLDFPGMSEEWKGLIRTYQKSAVWRILQEGRALLAHAVGLGKTLTMAASGMEAKRLGLSRKNMYAVPNHMVEQWREDFKRFYPNANVLAVQDEDFTPVNRGKLMSRIATGDWDAIVIPHSHFDLLPMSPEYEKATIDKRLASYRETLEELVHDPQGNKRSIKQIEKAVDKLESRLEELNDKKKDNVIPFDQLGVDQLYVDEAHYYKAMAVPTKMSGIKGLSNRASERALALEMKADFMRSTHKGRGLVLATGTPITNTMGELYVMTQYLAPEMLEKQGIRNFDDWAATFAQPKTEWAYAVDGVSFRPETSLAKFVNVPELSTATRRFGDFLSKAYAKLKEPTPNRKDVVARITPTQEPLLEWIANRGEKLRTDKTIDPREDNWLKLSSDARKISLDPRLLDPELRDEEGSKPNLAVKDIKEILDKSKEQKGTIAVFSDFFQHKNPDGKSDFNLFEDMRAKLVKQGVPKDQIAIIHDYPKKEQKAALFQKINDGDIRVIFGSTDKMGVGTNIQKRLKGLIHLDQPWRPDQVEQREGRIIRSGNMHDEVDIRRYIAEPEPGKIQRWDDKENKMVEKDRPRAFDLQMYQQLAKKAEFIEEFLSGNHKGREMEDAAGDVKLNSQMFQMAKAMASGNPDVLTKIKVENDMRSYQMLERNWQIERSKSARQLDQYQMMVPAIEHRIKQIKDAQTEWAKADDGKNASFEFGERKITDKDELKKYIQANPDLAPYVDHSVKLYGIDVPIQQKLFGDRVHYEYQQAGEWYDVPGQHDDPPTLQKLFTSFAARARSLGNRMETHEYDVRTYSDRIKTIQKDLAEPQSPYRAKLDKWEKQIEEINKRLGIKTAEEGVAEDEAGAAAVGDDAEDDGPKEDPNNSGEAGYATIDMAMLPYTLASEASKRINRVFNSVSERTGEALTTAGLGKTRPEIRQHDPALADEMTRLDAAYQYNREKAKQIVNDVIGGLSRSQEKGFVLLADASTREWLRENKPDEYQGYITDPQIISAIERYKPYEESMRDAAKELGTSVIEDDYLHRVYGDYTEGIDKANRRGTERSGFDQLVSPQVDRMRGRVKTAEYYYEKGLHEFGPSFATRWMSVMGKLQEHQVATDFMAKATKVGPISPKAREAMISAGKDPDRLPDSIYYNGKQFFSPEMAKLVKESRPGSEAAKKLAADLGISELPRPRQAREYGVYEPLKGKRLENSAAALAKAVLQQADDAQMAGRAATVLRSLSTRYLGPREVTEALTNSRPDLIPGATMWLSRKIAPATNLLRQQIVGLGFMVHFANDMRRIAQTAPGGVANPVGWARAVHVAFSKELKARSLSGTSDAGYDNLLKNAGISPQGAEEYKRYVELNTDPKNWFGLQNSFKEGGAREGRVSFGSVAGAPFKLAAEAMRPVSEFGHKILFGPGGMDQRSRLWLNDYLRSKDPTLSDADIAHLVNQRLGRYNRASWTSLQREIAPFMLFPGWDFSSMNYVLQHPIRTALPAAVVVWMANRIIHSMGGNSNEDKNDPLYIHVGKWNVSSNLLREPLAAHVAGPALRAGRELLSGHGAGRAAGEAVSGIPGDVAGVSTNLLHPYLQGAIETAANREHMGSGREIIRHGDSRRKALGFRGGKAGKDIGEHTLKTMVPLYGRYTRLQQGNALSPESALSNVGVTAYKRKKLH